MPDDPLPFAAVPGQHATVHLPSRPGDPSYVSVDQATRAALARRAEYAARPDVVAKELADAEADVRKAAERNARRKRPKLMQTTDYPWLKPDWVEPPVRPFKR